MRTSNVTKYMLSIFSPHTRLLPVDDHKLTIHEYVQGTHTNKAVAREVFKFVDHDHDNVLTRGETNRVFRIYDTDRKYILFQIQSAE